MLKSLLRKIRKKGPSGAVRGASDVGGSTADKATNIWDDRYESGELATARDADDTDAIDYTQHEFLHQQLVCKPLTGIPTLESHQLLMRSLFELVTPDKVLAVGCGLAHAEQSLILSNMVRHVDAYELSEVAVETARKRIADLGISDRLHLFAGDVTKAGIPENSYDAVYVNAAIHHFFNIEEMMDFFYAVLKPGGILVYDEYIGPDHHMYHDKVMKVINQMNDCLDESLRHDELSGSIRNMVRPATLEWMMEMDPSEGVHASQILPLTYQKFDVVQRFDYGGTLMRPFWVGILNNFDFSNPKDQTIARLVGLVEKLLIDCGDIPSYHTIVAARKGEQESGKLLLDNEVLSYRTHGYELEKLEPTIAHSENVLKCISLTDKSWLNGVSRKSPTRLLVANTPDAQSILETGTSVVFGPYKSAKITKFEAGGDRIEIQCEAETFDLKEVGKSAHFWVA